MDPITYSLCQKPVLGLLMFVASACGFPPLFHHEPFPLQRAGAHVVKEFEAPVSRRYPLYLNFHFPTAAASLADEIVGDRTDESCDRDHATISIAQSVGLGRPIPIHVLVREKHTGTVTMDKIVDTLCLATRGGPGFVKTRTAASLRTRCGELRHRTAQPGGSGRARRRDDDGIAGVRLPEIGQAA